VALALTWLVATVLRVEQVTKTYRMGEVNVPALRGIDLGLEQGELAVLLGASGSGKSTLLNILGGLDVPTTGHVGAIAKRPDVLLCDEPTGALDVETGKRVLAAIERVNRELDATTAVITHNAAIAAMADRVLQLADGRLVSDQRNATRAAPDTLVW
jgi:ABC-type lipoprotein export system ATPase subunit